MACKIKYNNKTSNHFLRERVVYMQRKARVEFWWWYILYNASKHKFKFHLLSRQIFEYRRVVHSNFFDHKIPKLTSPLLFLLDMFVLVFLLDMLWCMGLDQQLSFEPWSINYSSTNHHRLLFLLLMRTTALWLEIKLELRTVWRW
jgi:hypothetical protein